MKHSFIINYVFFFSVLWALVSCQGEEYVSGSDGMGYLSLEIGANASTQTKADGPAADYDPKKLFVQILDEEGTAVVSTVDWENEEFRLKAGTYTVKASSNGFDGLASCAKPYYAGSKEVTIVAGKKSTAELACTLANVKVTVAFDESFSRSFASAAVTVKSVLAGVDPHSYQMGTDDGDYYFPVGDLTAGLSVFNKQNVKFEHQEKIEGVKARDYYKLTYKVKEQGQGSITVNADGSERVYNFDFKVSTDPSAVVNVKTASAWSSFACLEGNAKDVKGNPVEASFLTFEYREESSAIWTAVTADIATDAKGNHSAILKGLTPEKKYMYRLVYKNGNEEVSSSESSFTTEVQLALPNGKLDDWYQDGKTWDAISKADFDAGKYFWDSSNPGTTTGAGAMVNKNPTQGVTDIVHTANGKSAKLESIFVNAVIVTKFAAASLYTGSYVKTVGTEGAMIDFGRPFTTRPTQLTGWFQYAPKAIDHVGGDQPANTVKEGNPDLWSAYIVLTNGTYQLNNTEMAKTSKDFASILKSGKPDASGFDVIAYGALPDAECVASSEWKQFTIDLTYRNLVEKPSHIIIVFSSSKYGDYFTGGNGSKLHLDDLELIYGDSPKLLGSGN
ncbi:DUF4493 domain-containing protein [Parabacteroides distasonis]|uniref:DUF4493 domain-containing protein n=1 Tax=Parabacteroides distasonis TaxID=823 RepID=A0A7L5EG45_PARDI|nr:PCMD domain-containing protein [Parabacteroides distasonis]QJE29543.1 DUF4493 domain-containing protein [Parabacteroides distasonis]WRY41517.1 PCMD domain-containing protein [Parabacteroides distasonis]